MIKYTVLATTVAAAMLTTTAFADLTLSKGQVVKTSPKAAAARYTSPGYRAERMPTGGVRIVPVPAHVPCTTRFCVMKLFGSNCGK